MRHGGWSLEAALFELRDCQMLHYSIVEFWFLNIDSRATRKTKVRPVGHWMDSCDVVDEDILKRQNVKNSIYERRTAVRCCGAYCAPETLLPRYWHILLGGGSSIVTSIFAYQGCQYFDYGLMEMHSHWIMQIRRPKIIHAPLRNICRI